MSSLSARLPTKGRMWVRTSKGLELVEFQRSLQGFWSVAIDNKQKKR